MSSTSSDGPRGRPTARRSHGERREEIVDAALRIIAGGGIAALTVATLAEEVGVTGGALYRHFPSTDAILEAVAERVSGLLDSSLPDETLPPLERLELFVQARSTAASGHPGVLRLMLSEQVTLAMPERAVTRLRASVRKTWDAIERALSNGQAEGTVRDDLPAAALVPVVIGTVQVLARFRTAELLPKKSVAFGTWSVLGTLLAPPQPKRKGRR